MSEHIVVDQNVLRKRDWLDPVIIEAQRTGARIIIPDIALAEMMKSSKWEQTTNSSLAILAEHADLVVVGHCLGELLKKEKETGVPHTDVINHETTPRIQELIREARNSSGPVINSIRNCIGQAQDMAWRQYFNHSRNREMLQNMVTALKNFMTNDEIKSIRRADDEFIIGFLSSPQMTAICKKMLVGAGFEEDSANRLSSTASVSIHSLLCFTYYSLRWMNNIDTVSDDTITNDLADSDYIVTSTFCRRLVSEDDRVCRISAIMNAVIEKRKAIS